MPGGAWEGPAWQKEGTTYSQGTWGSDYRHFVRGK